MAPISVERSIWIAAPRERVWQAVVEPEQVAQWFLPPAWGAAKTRRQRQTQCADGSHGG